MKAGQVSRAVVGLIGTGLLLVAATVATPLEMLDLPAVVRDLNKDRLVTSLRWLTISWTLRTFGEADRANWTCARLLVAATVPEPASTRSN